MDSSVILNTPNKSSKRNKTKIMIIDPFFRRILDVIASSFGLFVLSPIFLLVAILIKRDSPGPVFYRGPRIGKNGTEFGILKFRTMYERAESYHGSKVTGSGDRRITPIGQWLRDTKLNEFPQFWNVLMGDMSLVGPRPEDPNIVAGWDEEIRDIILSVRPGITSPASIQYRDEENLLSSGNLMEEYLKKILPSKLRLDSMYVQRRTIISDIDVVLLTIINILPKNRKKVVHESTLYNGPLMKLVNRHVIWFVIDSLITLSMIILTGVIWRLSVPINVGLLCACLDALLAAFVFSIINMALGLHKISWSSAGGILTLDLGLSTILATMFILSANQLRLMPGYLPPTMLGMAGILSFFGFIAVRYRKRIFAGIPSRYLKQTSNRVQFMKERVLIIGAGELGGMASWLINHGDFSRAFSVVGFLDDDPVKAGMIIDGSPVLGMISEMESIIDQNDIALVVFAITQISDKNKVQIIKKCKKSKTNYFVFPQILDLMLSSLNQDIITNVNADDCLLKVEEFLSTGKSELALQEIQKFHEQRSQIEQTSI